MWSLVLRGASFLFRGKPMLIAAVAGLGIPLLWSWGSNYWTEWSLSDAKERISLLETNSTIRQANIEKLQEALEEQREAVRDSKKEAVGRAEEREKVAESVLQEARDGNSVSTVGELNSFLLMESEE